MRRSWIDISCPVTASWPWCLIALKFSWKCEVIETQLAGICVFGPLQHAVRRSETKCSYMWYVLGRLRFAFGWNNLGGINVGARALAAFLVPIEGERLVGVRQIRLHLPVPYIVTLKAHGAVVVPSHCRQVFGHTSDNVSIIVTCSYDRSWIALSASYLGSEFPKVLAQPDVEYRQANLSNASAIASCFDPPAGRPAFDYVFDLSGETRYDRAESVRIYYLSYSSNFSSKSTLDSYFKHSAGHSITGIGSGKT